MKTLLTLFASSLVLASCVAASPGKVSEATSSSTAASVAPAKSTEQIAMEKLTAALVESRLKLEVIREAGGRNGCEPQGPYYRLKVSRRVTEPYMEDPQGPDGGRMTTRTTYKETDLGMGIRYEEESGRVSVMDVCLE